MKKMSRDSVATRQCRNYILVEALNTYTVYIENGVNALLQIFNYLVPDFHELYIATNRIHMQH